MKKPLVMTACLAGLAAVGLVLAGCATSDVNPTRAQTKTGYVDFYADSATDVCWQISRFEGGQFQPIYMTHEPPQDGFLRLALAPGSYRLRITFSNRVIASPAEVDVAVEEGRITPVQVTLAGGGNMQVQTKEANVGNTMYGRYGRNTKIRSDEQATYTLSATVGAPVAYDVKSKMRYARY